MLPACSIGIIVLTSEQKCHVAPLISIANEPLSEPTMVAT